MPLLGRLWATAWLPSILFAGCLVSLMYLLQTSGVATTGYDIQHLQVERDDWQLRNEQLRLELAKRQSLTWIESAPGVLAFARESGLTCVVNLNPDPVDLPPYAEILLTSNPLEDGQLPTDTTAWLRTG